MDDNWNIVALFNLNFVKRCAVESSRSMNLFT